MDRLWGDSRAWLFNVAKERSVDLIMTSPPFGLVRKKDYGNEDADLYCDWFRDFAEGFHRVLKDDGSLVIDIGGAWVEFRQGRSFEMDEQVRWGIFRTREPQAARSQRGDSQRRISDEATSGTPKSSCGHLGRPAAPCRSVRPP